MKVHDTRSHAHASADEEGKIGTRKQKAEAKAHDVEKNKKAKVEKAGDNDQAERKPAADTAAEFEEFCKTTREHLSVNDVRKILEVNDQDPSGSDDAVIFRCQDMMFYGALERCPVCGSQLDFKGSNYACTGSYSEWTKCPYTTRESSRKQQPIKIPEDVSDDMVADWVRKQDPSRYPQRALTPLDKPFTGMMISLSGRLSRTHHYWREVIEKHGGKVSNTVPGVTCLVVSPAERERGGSSKVIEAMERSIPVVREGWLTDSIEKQQAQPLDAYEAVADITVEGRGIPWSKQDPSEEALESISAELKLYGKRGVHTDSRLQEEGGQIFEKDGILYNCAFSNCDQRRGVNEFCIMQLIVVPENRLHLYYKRGRVGDDARAEERVEEKADINKALKEFAQLFEEITGNEFEPWEREKIFKKQPLKFYPIDIDDGFDVRYGGLGIRQLGVAVTHSKLDPHVAKFMSLMCSQEVYRYALMELGHDSPDLPVAMLSNLHLRRCEELLLEFIEQIKKSSAEKSGNNDVLWLDFSNKWFTLMHSSRPFTIRDFEELGDHVAAALETIRDTVAASHLIGDLTSDTLDDPLYDRYNKLGCSICPLEKESDDYKMIINYLEKTYEPVQLSDVSYDVTVDNIFAVESSGGASHEDIKKLPNKMLLWCGTRTSNLLRHLQKGFLPAACGIPVPGYMFGKAIICSDAAADAARYGFTAADRPDGFLVLAVAALGEQVIELSSAPEDTKELEDKKAGVKGIGRKRTDEAEHITWKDDIKVPCGRLIPSGCDGSPLEYNEYAVYDPKQTCLRFLAAVKYEERNVEIDVAE